ncbi:MAG: hypothetical protein E7518_00090 [Ruminococcaceae bacterium]|nr:hypothetical protein [Oscillospiraceae bacterium]
MIPIILCGKSNDTAILDALVPALSEYGNVLCFGPQKLTGNADKEADFIVFDCEKLPSIDLKTGILLFKNSFEAQGPLQVPDGFSCILDSQNLHAAAALRGSCAAAITCGTSSKDTISIAALDETSASLSLQRSILTISGTVLEPHDFTVSLRPSLGPHRVLAVCAVLLVCGIESSEGYTI